ncbi:glycosyltransferase [Sphaerotilaceae bacterium SBD11-9]
MEDLKAVVGGSVLSTSTQRWVFDLQACQTAGSAHRGVGRYSHSLFNAVRTARPAIDFRAVSNETLQQLPKLPSLSPDRRLQIPELPGGLGARKYQGGPQDDLEGILLSNRLAPLKADLIHLSHVFEGFSDRVALPSHSYKAPGQVLSATLYDLIPLLFQDHYFQDADFARWYHSRLDWLRQADLLLAISESSRKDAINLLGIDPSRIVTVHGGIGKQFVPAMDRGNLRKDLQQRYGLRDRFVLYTGGDDHRKNIAGGIRGYAQVPAQLRKQCQLVVVCSMEEARKGMYADIGKQAGLSDNDMLFTGFVPETDLVAFYQCCDAFIFPSLYEGLGLPVLEAMACGAPTIGGNNSSICELINRPDALFDASSTADLARVLSQVLSDPSFAQTLGESGPQRAKSFTWEKTADIASKAMLEAVKRAQGAGVSAAVHGWLPKKRLAILTPLPPSRSGIADYSAKFLPYLARHFDIDLIVDDDVHDAGLASTFQILTVRQFEQIAHRYDAILYEVGNSEFHHHMLPLIKRFPGVVGLHDAFLSGLESYQAHRLGNADLYPRAMIEAHASRARRFYAPAMHHPDPNGAALVALPCTKAVLDAATGVISHSPFNLEVASSNYPEGWQAPYRIIPQMVHMPASGSARERDALRQDLGFSNDDIVVVTLGHVVWTKWGDRLLDAFLQSPLRDDPKAHLVYVGEILLDDFGKKLAERIAAAGLGDRISVTGFLPEEQFERFLRIADMAIQLRTKSRGGTPKGVLDCLAYGLPVVVNDDASYRDYPDDVVYKLPADPSTSDISLALTTLSQSAPVRHGFSTRGIQYVRDQHDPAKCASMYAAAIHEFSSRARLASPTAAVDALGPLVGRSSSTVQSIRTLAHFVAGQPLRAFARRRIFIDVSCTALVDLETGIQRVVKKVVHHLYTLDVAGVEAVAVQLTGGRLHVASKWLIAKGLLHPSEVDSIEPDREVTFHRGDILFMLDSSWARYEEFYPSFARARAAGATVMTAVYDLLPLQLPDGFIIDGGPQWFRNWVIKAVNASDAIVAISRSVALDVKEFIEKEPGLQRRPSIGYWHLGSDIANSAAQASSSDAIARIGSKPYLLMVGTIEPRKSHALVLDAMERLWSQGLDLGLCIAGKEGWLVDELMVRLRGHQELGRKFHLFEHPTDADITQLYEHAAALLFVSKGEGFGLPLVEAANHGTPIVCSDLPVFREICGDHATYLSGWAPEQIATEVTNWWTASQSGLVPGTHDMPRLTWEQSARALLDVVVNEEWIE